MQKGSREFLRDCLRILCICFVLGACVQVSDIDTRCCRSTYARAAINASLQSSCSCLSLWSLPLSVMRSEIPNESSFTLPLAFQHIFLLFWSPLWLTLWRSALCRDALTETQIWAGNSHCWSSICAASVYGLMLCKTKGARVDAGFRMQSEFFRR